MEIKRAVDIGGNTGEKISGLFVEAFEKDLRFFSNNKDTLIRAFTHIFALEYFYAAIIDNEIAGMAVCIDQTHFCIRHNLKILIHHLGIVKGFAAHFVFTHYFNRFPKYPMELDEKTASIEFVAVSGKWRRRGAASAVIKYICAISEYNHFVLEVADTNTAAFTLYQKLGFHEVRRKALKWGKKYSGISHLVYMRYTKE